MKKIYMLGSLALIIGLTACSKDGYTERTQTVGGSAITIISSEDDDDVTVSDGYYVFSLKMTDTTTTGTVTSPDLVANNDVLTFTTDDQSYKSTGYDAYFENAQGKAGGMQLRNANFLVLYIYDEQWNKYGYYVNTSNVGEYTYSISQVRPDYIALASYNIGNNLKVRTFQPNTFFIGDTSTSYTMAGETHNYSTKSITYRFMMKKDADTKEYTADLLIYNAKFSDNEREPVKEAILAENLKVDFSKSGVTITGENIVPKMLEAGAYVPVPSFSFDYVRFSTNNDNLTSGIIDYKVAGVYVGHFEGSYLNTYYMK